MIDHGKQADPGSSSTPNTGTSHSSSPSADSLKQQGRDTVHDVSEAAQHQAESLFNRQRDTAAEQTNKFTNAINKMADEFDSQEQPYFSQQARKLADTADRFSNKLRDKDLKSLCQEAQSYSRREPALFFGGAIAAGFLLTRFLRSSGQHSHSSSQHSQSSGNQSHQSSGAYSSHASPTPGNPSDGIMHGSSPGASQDPTAHPCSSQPGATSLGVTTSPTPGSSNAPGTSNTPGSSAGSVNKPGGPGRI
ncbi:hypothetical protein [Vreelandella populi]|uniref:hypothetical protein n=1 Tax=Vreelandella populi TaxID=2498858 RepID=UPI00163B934A|nr:hypothetical protein [Halomonas populi]